jgi:hypothetical protein
MRLVAIVGIALFLALPGWAAPPRRATLKLGSVAPLVVRGVDFGAGERVAVVASLQGAQEIVNTKARRNGRFTATFKLGIQRCVPLTVRAIGSLGSRAILQRAPGCSPTDKAKKRGR